MPQATISMRRGFDRTQVADVHQAKAPASFGWSNVDLKVGTSFSGDQPIEFLLQILLSTKGDLTNTAYDVFEDGIGLGIPSDFVDVTSFTNIQAHDDYDSNQRVFFKFKEPPQAKKYIEDELCLPFGYYLITGNDGRVKLTRPRHPQKFLISPANDELKANYPSGSGDPESTTLAVGIYTAQELAAHVQYRLNDGLPHGGADYTCTYDTGIHKFLVQKGADSFDIVAGDKGWQTLGFTANRTNVSGVQTADVAKGAFSGLTLDKYSLRDVSLIENRADQITEVMYLMNYKLATDEFEHQIGFVDAEGVNLGDSLGARRLVIKSKGLVAADVPSPWHLFVPGGTCQPDTLGPKLEHTVKETTWAETYARMLLDRYRNPPLKFKAKLSWEYNVLEVGDVVRLDYDIAGVFADYELEKSAIAGRLFEIVQLNPNFRDGFLDATFLGHRYVSY